MIDLTAPHAETSPATGHRWTRPFGGGRRAVGLLVALAGVVAVLTAVTPAWAQTPGEFEQEFEQREMEEGLPEDLAFEEGGEVPEGEPVAEGATVDVVQVVGNRRVEAESVLQRVGTEPGEPLDLDQISTDIQRVFDLGYFRDVQVDATRTAKGKVVVSFVVEEKPAIGEIRYEGNDELDDDELADVVNLRKYAVLDISKVKENAEKIRELYAEKGFYLAEVDYDITAQQDRADLAVVTFEIREFAKVQVKQVTLLGNEALPDAELRNIMQTREGSYFSFLTDFGNFNEKHFEADLQRLTAYYYDKGYVQVNVNRPTIRLSRDKQYLYITIRIEEGPQFDTASVDLQGDFIIPKEELAEMVELTPETTFSFGTMRQDIERIRTFYRNQGYAYVNVNPLTRVNPETRSVDVTYDIQKGNKVYFARIEIVGNDKTRDKVIRRELEIEEGELFSEDELEESKRQVRRLGFFEKVEITTQRGPTDDLINATVEVSETRTGTFQIGAGFSSTESFIANAQISQNNLLGRGQSLSFTAQLSGIRSLFNLKFSEPWLFDTRWRFSFDLYNFEYAYQDFTRSSTGGDLTFGYPLTEAFELPLEGDLVASLTYKYEDVEIDPDGRGGRNRQPQGSLFKGGTTSSVRSSVFYDTRDNRLFPTEGQLHTASVELADDDLTFSESEFLKYDIETRWYFPLFWRFVLRLNGEFGYVTSLDGDQPVPLFERYFVGGPQTVRGFDRFALGPVREIGLTGEPGTVLTPFRIGGDKQLVFTAEIEFPIFAAAGIKGVVFADAGNAFGEDEDLTLQLDVFTDQEAGFRDALRTSVGFGFRWLSPIAPLRFEWGIPLARLRGEDPLVFDFSIGNAF